MEFGMGRVSLCIGTVWFVFAVIKWFFHEEAYVVLNEYLFATRKNKPDVIIRTLDGLMAPWNLANLHS